MKLCSFEKKERCPGSFQTTVCFGDEIKLSVISGKGAYSSADAPYEIAIFRNDKFTHLPGITRPDDGVRGWLTEQEVNVIIKKLITATGSTPEPTKA